MNRGTYIPLYDSDYEGLIGVKPPPPEKLIETPNPEDNSTENSSNINEEKSTIEKQDEKISIQSEAKELTQLALKGSLTLQQQQRLSALLDQDPNIVYEIGVTPYQVLLICFFINRKYL